MHFLCMKSQKKAFYSFADSILLLHLSRASLLRSAPFELPQVGNEARVESCSDAIRGACPFLLSYSKNGFPHTDFIIINLALTIVIPNLAVIIIPPT